MPTALVDLQDVEFYDWEVDFCVALEVWSAEETTRWWRRWTRNDEANADDLRIIGEDNSGGYAAFWLVRDGLPETEQPVVFLGSEGEVGVVANNLSDLLWLLAGGVGPWEVVAEDVNGRDPIPEVEELVEPYVTTPRRSPPEIVETARAQSPDLLAWVKSQAG